LKTGLEGDKESMCHILKRLATRLNIGQNSVNVSFDIQFCNSLALAQDPSIRIDLPVIGLNSNCVNQGGCSGWRISDGTNNEFNGL
jgi:hypothetical protein